jgi:Tfp pilus assembly protein PilV
MRTRARTQRGETLVESLCTITIVALGVVALTTAMGDNFHFSRQSRDSATADALIGAYAENLQNLAYEPCNGSNTPYASTAAGALPTQFTNVTVMGSGTPSGSSQFLLTITARQYWNGNTNPATWSSNCPSASDPGAQKLTIAVTPGDNVITRTLTFVKRQ